MNDYLDINYFDVNLDMLKNKHVAVFIDRPPLDGCPPIYSLRYFVRQYLNNRWKLIKTFNSSEEAKIWADIHGIKLTS